MVAAREGKSPDGTIKANRGRCDFPHVEPGGGGEGLMEFGRQFKRVITRMDTGGRPRLSKVEWVERWSYRGLLLRLLFWCVSTVDPHNQKFPCLSIPPYPPSPELLGP